MPMEKATALVLRTTNWSETSRIATLWTREHGIVRALAKGGRRLRSRFENALDLLTVCSIVFIRKSPGTLDLLTEATVVKRFPGLTRNLSALYGGYYLAELLSEWMQEADPHPELFEEALKTLETMGGSDQVGGAGQRAEPSKRPGIEVIRFELKLLSALGYRPGLEVCSGCAGTVEEVTRQAPWIPFSAEAGGIICGRCRSVFRDQRTISRELQQWLNAMLITGEEPHQGTEQPLEAEARRVLSQYVTWIMGHQPRLLPYLEQGS